MSVNQKILNKILASYATGVRGDLDIADFQKLNNVTAHMLIEFAPNIGKPKADDIERYFGKMFEGRIQPVMASVSVKANCVSVIAQLQVPQRPFEDTADKTKMTPVMGGLMYLDNQLQDVWQVKQDVEGKKVLAKESKENIDQIIAARRNRVFVTQSSNVSLASVAQARELIPAGSTVKAWYQGSVQNLVITAKVNGGYEAKNAEGRTVTVAKEGVIDLIQMAESAPNESAKIAKYFSDAYGDKKYASLMTKK